MNNSNAVDFINKLEGYKTAVKGIHWENTNNAEHKTCDDFYSAIGDYQDSIAEDMGFTYGRIEKTQLFPVTFVFDNLEELVRSLLEDVILFRQDVSTTNSPYDFGVLSITDDFIHAINQSGFRSQLN